MIYAQKGKNNKQSKHREQKGKQGKETGKLTLQMKQTARLSRKKADKMQIHLTNRRIDNDRRMMTNEYEEKEVILL